MEPARRGPLIPALLTVLCLVQAGTLALVLELGSREPARSAPRAPVAPAPEARAANAAASSAAGAPPELAEELRAIRAELVRLRAELAARSETAGSSTSRGAPQAPVGPVPGSPVSDTIEAAARVRAFEEGNHALYELRLTNEERLAEVQARAATFLGLNEQQRTRLGEVLLRLKQETAGPAREIELLFERHRERQEALRQTYAKDRRSKRLDAEAEALARWVHAEYHRLKGPVATAHQQARAALRELVGPTRDPAAARFLEHNAASWLAGFGTGHYGLSWGEGPDVKDYLKHHGLEWVRYFREDEEEE